MNDRWFENALKDIEADPTRAVVFGRRREVNPQANAYHRACDDEWNVPLGKTSSCGGDALFPAERFEGSRQLQIAIDRRWRTQTFLHLRQARLANLV